jgi:hypothetical protein
MAGEDGRRETKADPRVNDSTGYLVGRLWRDWMRAYLGRMTGAAILMTVVAATSAAYPKLIQMAVDMLGDADPRILTLMPAAIIAITFTRGIASYGQSVLSQSVALRVIAELQKAMFARLMHTDLASLHSAPTGVHISRFTNDVNLMRDARFPYRGFPDWHDVSFRLGAGADRHCRLSHRRPADPAPRAPSAPRLGQRADRPGIPDRNPEPVVRRHSPDQGLRHGEL